MNKCKNCGRYYEDNENHVCEPRVALAYSFGKQDRMSELLHAMKDVPFEYDGEDLTELVGEYLSTLESAIKE